MAALPYMRCKAQNAVWVFPERKTGLSSAWHCACKACAVPAPPKTQKGNQPLEQKWELFLPCKSLGFMFICKILAAILRCFWVAIRNIMSMNLKKEGKIKNKNDLSVWIFFKKIQIHYQTDFDILVWVVWGMCLSLLAVSGRCLRGKITIFLKDSVF